MSELARRANVSTTLMSDVLNGKVAPSCDFCLKVADALGKQRVDLLRLAHYLPPVTPETEEEEEATQLLRTLRPYERECVLRMLRGLAQTAPPVLVAPKREATGIQQIPAQEQPAAPEVGETELDRFGSEQFYALMGIAENMGTDALLKMFEVLAHRLREQRQMEKAERGVGEAKGEQRST